MKDYQKFDAQIDVQAGGQKSGVTGNGTSNAATQDKNSIAIDIVSFLIPIYGFVGWLCWRKKAPNRASGACLAAWLGVLVNVVFLVIEHTYINGYFPGAGGY